MPERPVQRRRGATPLADLVAGALDPVLARQGFSESVFVLYWEEIAGERLAAVSQPIRLQWPPRGRSRAPDALPEPATLVLRVEGAFAIELQHVAPLLIDRANAHLGWRCIGRIALRQAPLQRAAKTRRKPPPGEQAEALAAARAATDGIDDDALRQALTRLGTKVLANS